MLKNIRNIFRKKETITQENTSPTLIESLQTCHQYFKQHQFSNLLEIGSRDGFDAEQIRGFFKIMPTDVFIVEANPECANFIKRTYKYFNVLNKAIFDQEKTLQFNQVTSENIGTSSLLNRTDNYYEGKSKKINVECITGQHLLKLYQIEKVDFLKLDVEGATYEVLQSFGNDISNIKFLHLESEHKVVWENQKLYSEIKHFLENKGFKQIFFEFVSSEQLQSDSIWMYDN